MEEMEEEEAVDGDEGKGYRRTSPSIRRMILLDRKKSVRHSNNTTRGDPSRQVSVLGLDMNQRASLGEEEEVWVRIQVSRD